MEITKENFEVSVALVEETVKWADFIAIDLELSGCNLFYFNLFQFNLI